MFQTGIDLRFRHLPLEALHGDLAVRGLPALTQVSNHTAGPQALISHMSRLEPALAVLEGVGGYESEAACALHTAGLAVAEINVFVRMRSSMV